VRWPARLATAVRTRLLPALVVASAALAFCAAIGAAPARADAPPSVTINQASAVGYTTAQLNGTVNPNGGPSSVVWYLEYTPYLEYTMRTHPYWRVAGSGELTEAESEEHTPHPVTASLEELPPNTTYLVRLLAVDEGGAREVVTQAPYPSFTTIAVAPPTTTLGAVSAITETTAHFSGTIDPNAPGAAPQDPAFDTSWHFECLPECPGLAGGELAGDDLSHEVSAEATGLLPNTIYMVVLVAANLGGQEVAGPVPFATPAIAPTLSASYASEVGATSAGVEATIDPNGSATSYYVEYGPSEGSYTASAPAPPGEQLGAGQQAKTAGIELEGLQSATVYHYRVVTSNPAGTVYGHDRSFTTGEPDGPFALPDDRAYELVSPAEKGNADVTMQRPRGEIVPSLYQASVLGGAITYQSESAFAGAQANTRIDQYYSTRGPTGWSTVPITAPQSPRTFGFLRDFGVFAGFTEDLSFGYFNQLFPLLTPTSGPPAPAGYDVLYARSQSTGGVQPLLTSQPPDRAPGKEDFANGEFDMSFVGASANGGDVVFSASDALAPGALDPGPYEYVQLYDWRSGALHLVNVLPDGTTAARAGIGVRAGSNRSTNPSSHLTHAISEDGRRIFWTDLGTGDLYVREDERTTVQLNESHGPGPDGEAEFQGASGEGSRAFFTDESRLTADSNAGPGVPDLYEYDLQSKTLSDLTSTDPAGGQVLAVLGISQDGASVYFVANGALTAGASEGECTHEEGGGCGLYVSHREGTTHTIRRIATLTGADYSDWAKPGPEQQTAEVSPNGRYLAFESSLSLTGYDNTDVTSGAADSEVFVYDAQTGRLSCASCEPSGAQPTGPARLPDWQWNVLLSEAGNAVSRQPRYMLDDGRVFFNSQDAVLAQDTNGRQDVYEYEPPAIGSCPPAQTDGCVSLISRGTSSDDSTFADASASGQDVFFLTRQQLVAQDTDEALDLYDARESGGFPAPPSTACSGTGCQGIPPAQPSFATPASVTLTGVGNFPAPRSLKSKPTPKPTRAQRLAGAIRACGRRAKRERAACRARARKRFGAARKAAKRAQPKHAKRARS
jgi:hypothetical protein